MPHVLASTYLEALPPGERDRAPPLEELTRELEHLVATGQVSWPQVPVAPEAFVRAVAERMANARGPARLAELAAGDLWLVTGCVGRLDVAVTAFEELYREVWREVAVQLKKPPRDMEDTAQAVLARLLVGSPTDGPLLARFGARGRLRAWLRTLAVREALAAEKARGRTVSLEDAAVGALALDGLGAELEHVKQGYANEFREAFREALGELTPKERNLLRYSLIDGLSIDQIGALYGSHRATAARWLAAVRAKLREATQRRLAARLAVGETEVASVMRLIASRLDATLDGVLSPEDL